LQKQPLSNRNVRELLLRAHESHHAMCSAFKAVRLYQRAGYDFSSEISTLVVKSAIARQKPMLAADLFLASSRLPAWLSKRSAAALVGALANSEDGVEPAVKILQAAQSKGLSIAQPALTLAMQESQSNETVVDRIKSIAGQVLGETAAI
jgi:hypothetical protein